LPWLQLTRLNPSSLLNFDGRCEEAVEFYRSALGAKVDELVRMGDSTDPERSVPGADDKVWHTTFRIGATTFMASDCRCTGKPNFQGFSLALGAATNAEADRYFAALSDGGDVEMPLTKTSWSSRFGVVTDRFGVCWMVNTLH
jgi:PhnB protein